MSTIVVFAIALLIPSVVAVLLPVIKRRVKERTAQGAAVRTAKQVWDHGSDEQRRAMLDLIDVMEGSYRDSLLTKVWDELPETVRASIAQNFRR